MPASAQRTARSLPFQIPLYFFTLVLSCATPLSSFVSDLVDRFVFSLPDRSSRRVCSHLPHARIKISSPVGKLGCAPYRQSRHAPLKSNFSANVRKRPCAHLTEAILDWQEPSDICSSDNYATCLTSWSRSPLTPKTSRVWI